MNVDEEAVFILIRMKTLHVVQQHGIGIIEVRMGDEARRVCERDEKWLKKKKKKKKAQAKPLKFNLKMI